MVCRLQTQLPVIVNLLSAATLLSAIALTPLKLNEPLLKTCYHNGRNPKLLSGLYLFLFRLSDGPLTSHG